MTRSALTEETPNTPGWVDSRLDELAARLGEAASGPVAAYADCLAGCRGAVDVDAGHDRCRRALLAALADKQVPTEGLERELMALEAEISNGT